MNRFTKKQRLLNAQDYKNVFDSAVRSQDKNFTVLATPSKQQCARLGLAITKKKVKRAVDRNRLKRLIRESFRQAENKYNADYIVLVSCFNKQIKSQQLINSLNKHWQKLNKKCNAF